MKNTQKEKRGSNKHVLLSVSYTTTTVTATAAALSSFVTDVVTNIPTVTDVVPESVFVTIPETVTDVETVVATSTDHEPSFVTVFVTETTTSARVTIEPRKERRALEPRVTSSCPDVRYPTAVPSYASACSGTVRFSSACACIGVTGSTTTITPAATVSTVTVSVTSTPTVVVGVTATETLPVTITEASEVLVTETAVTTITDLVSSVVIETVVVPTTTTATVDVAPPVCTSFALQAESGPHQGLYVDASSGLLEFASAEESSGSTFAYDPTTSLVTVLNAPGLSGLPLSTLVNPPYDADWVAPADGLPPLDCTLTVDPATGILAQSFDCTTSIGYNYFYSCDSFQDLVIIASERVSQ